MRYVIDRLINNNVVFSTDEGGREVILFGKAIGFGHRRGDAIDASCVLKVFGQVDASSRNYLSNLVEDIDPVYIDLATRTVSMFEERLGIRTGAMMIVSLSDHLNNAVRNKREGFETPLGILHTIREMYPKEFAVARDALDLVGQTTGIWLGEAEAGYVVMHYLNTQGDTYRGDAKLRVLFQERVIEAVERRLGVRLDRRSAYYARLLTHLSFLATRMRDGEMPHDGVAGDPTLYEMLLSRYPKLAPCVDEACVIVEEELGMHVNAEEKAYLAIHLGNLFRSMGGLGS